ncbi:MAG: hypothetical protein KJN65_00105 [Croceitalea sp.]|nr:hypothetical protein [Croceitalea sp.]
MNTVEMGKKKNTTNGNFEIAVLCKLPGSLDAFKELFPMANRNLLEPVLAMPYFGLLDQNLNLHPCE